ncbi:MAG: HAD family phosphatase [Bacteroidales bacterium]|nr:HAD family phosphatase [Bacteroidales bacterium]
MSLSIDKSRKLQIFDLGGVLIEVDAKKTLSELQALGFPAFDGVVSNSHAAGGIFTLYCNGLVTTDEFIAGLRSDFHISATDEQLVNAWNAMLGDFIVPNIETVRRLRSEGFTIALLSNCNELHTVECRRRFTSRFNGDSFDDLFDSVFFSQEIHKSKPELSTWQLVLDHHKASPSDAAFYDDNDTNCLAAASLGISAVQVL